MSQYKIIFTGPVGAGKTSAIAALSDRPPLSTDAQASDMTRQRKAETTVALDYGIMDLPGGERVHLYGTPGQERFDFMWGILTQGGIGLVLLIDHARQDPLADMRFFLEAFRDFIAATAVVVGITRTDMRPVANLRHYRDHATQLGYPCLPIFEVDARDRDDLSLLIEALLCTLDPGVVA